ncbi:MAG TPA: hypothetical protein ENH46_00635 [Candidatus Pacearchaeota archaeon]|nr:hypothetical protein [Candidatus Pacearchaeota archaeon]
MTNKIKKIWDKFAGVISIFTIFLLTWIFIKGFAELIENQSIYVIIFYMLVCMMVCWKLSKVLLISLNKVFNKGDKT